MDLIFCKLEKAKNHEFRFFFCFSSLKNLKKHEIHLLQAKKPQKT